MATLWKWGIRAPFAAIAILSFALSAAGVTDWSIGTAGMAFGGVVACAANRLLGKVEARQEAAAAQLERARRSDIVRGRFDNLDADKSRRKSA